MINQQVREKYRLEYKVEAARRVKSGQSGAVVAKVLGIPSSSLPKWVRLDSKGELAVINKLDAKEASVTPEQI